VDGAIWYAHEFLNANTLDVVYMTTANLPLTYEIENSATAASATILEQICSTVISEGGFNPQGFIRSANNGVTGKTIGTAALAPIISVRLKSTYANSQLHPLKFEILGQTANFYLYWEARVRGTLTSASFSAASAAVEYDTAATALTGGDLVASGYISPETEMNSSLIPEDIPLTSDGTNTDILTIQARAIGGNVTAVASVMWREIW
jgi:hypothetical protein